MSDSTTKHKLWTALLAFLILGLVIIILYGLSHPFIIRFEMAMDNNTLESIKSINYTALQR